MITALLFLYPIIKYEQWNSLTRTGTRWGLTEYLKQCEIFPPEVDGLRLLSPALSNGYKWYYDTPDQHLNILLAKATFYHFETKQFIAAVGCERVPVEIQNPSSMLRVWVGGELYTGSHTEISIFYLSIRRFCLQTAVDIVDI